MTGRNDGYGGFELCFSCQKQYGRRLILPRVYVNGEGKIIPHREIQNAKWMMSNLVVALNNAMAIPIAMEAILIAMWLKAAL